MVAANDDLIEIKPGGKTLGACIACNHTETLTGELFFQGVHTLMKFTCRKCRTVFYQTLPAGHDLLFPSAFAENGNLLRSDPSAAVWLTDPLLRSMFGNRVIEVDIEKVVHETHQDAIILNCLDNRFGHSFAKLWNAAILKDKYPERSIIVFIPAALRWLVPDNISEIWVFNAPLAKLKHRIANLDGEVKRSMSRFSNIWLSKAYTHLSIDKVGLQKLLGTTPFDLSQFSSTAPSITFVLREDRFWQSTSFEFFLFKVAVKFNLSKRLFVWRQNYLVNKTARAIRKQITAATFSAVGIGRHGRLAAFISDHRKDKLSAHDEHSWCQVYAASHVITGVHGSGMLIPTALAAGFVEILPRYKIRHIGEDITLNHSSRYLLFLGRHVDQFARTGLVSRHIISMIRDFPYVYRNVEQDV